MTTDLERSITSIVQAAINEAEEPDVAAIAERVSQELDVDLLRREALSGIRYRVRTALATIRRGVAEGANGSSARWDTVKAENASGELDLARFAVWTGKTQKWLLDCTPTDLLSAADWHQERGEHYIAAAGQLTNLANHLKRKPNAEVVGDLAEDKVRGILSA